MTEETKTEGAASAPVVSIIGGPAREKVVPLTFTYEIGGNTVDSITVRRLRTSEVRDRDFKALVELMTGYPVEVLDELDPDDGDAVGVAISDFLPLRLRQAAGLTQATGESS